MGSYPKAQADVLSRPLQNLMEPGPGYATHVAAVDIDAADEPIQEPPLCVDLDGTLLRTDLLHESLFELLRRRPLAVLAVPLWLWRGKAHLKQKIAARAPLDASALPYHEPFLAYLREQHHKGRRLILATAANVDLAREVARHLGLFERVVASDARINISGAVKLERLRALFGEGGFDYAGNGRADLEVWGHARRAILVNPDRGVPPAARNVARVERIFEDRPLRAWTLLRALRLHHWVKNLLLFVPLAATHALHEGALLAQAALGFLAFGLTASSVYLLNDLLDLNADRQHPGKRQRPFASGALPIAHGIGLIPILLVAGIGIAASLPPLFLPVLGAYYAATLAYSFGLKRVAILDVLVLAGLYTARVIAGGIAVGITPSFWLLAFSMFLFLSLAVVKRYSELLTIGGAGENLRRRGYCAADLGALNGLGAASGLMAVLVLALYVNSEAVTVLYGQPELIWLLCPLLLYWMARVWLLTGRGDMRDDPVLFAIQDRVSHALAAAAALILWLAV